MDLTPSFDFNIAINCDEAVNQLSAKAAVVVRVGVRHDAPIYAPKMRQSATDFPFGANAPRMVDLLYEKTPAGGKKKRKRVLPLYAQTTSKYGKRVMAMDKSKIWRDSEGKSWTVFGVWNKLEKEYHIISRSWQKFCETPQEVEMLHVAFERYLKRTTTAGRNAGDVLLEECKMIIVNRFLKGELEHNNIDWIAMKGNSMWGIGTEQTLDSLEAWFIEVRGLSGKFSKQK